MKVFFYYWSIYIQYTLNYIYSIRNHIGGEMVSVLDSSAVGRGFDRWPGHTKGYRIGIWNTIQKYMALLPLCSVGPFKMLMSQIMVKQVFKIQKQILVYLAVFGNKDSITSVYVADIAWNFRKFYSLDCFVLLLILYQYRSFLKYLLTRLLSNGFNTCSKRRYIKRISIIWYG